MMAISVRSESGEVSLVKAECEIAFEASEKRPEELCDKIRWILEEFSRVCRIKIESRVIVVEFYLEEGQLREALERQKGFGQSEKQGSEEETT